MSQGSYPVLSVDPSTVNDENPMRKIGSKYSHYDSTYGWRTLMYVYLDDAVDAALGSVAILSDKGRGNVTCDVSGGSAVAGPCFMGIFVGTVTATQYGFIVCGVGDHAFVSTGGSESAGGFLVAGGADKTAATFAPTSQDPTVAEILSGHTAGIGFLIADDSSTGGTVQLTQGA